jgi:hypothetical protein
MPGLYLYGYKTQGLGADGHWIKRLLRRKAGISNMAEIEQLRLRFGVLPPEAIERLSHATQAELDAWGEAILSAPTLDAVFGETRH